MRDQAEMLMGGSEFGDEQLRAAMEERLRARLAEGRPLRVYAGYDPTAPDLHLGHAVTLRKLRQFQDLGHEVTVVIGTVTAMVGDTSDRATGRPRKSRDEVVEAARGYADQCFTVLDRRRTNVLSNADWLERLSLTEVLDLASQFTVQQFLARDNYRRRIDKGEPVGLHEFLYALLQGHDAVHLRADVQLGGTEQLFNILAASKLQEANGQPPCVALTVPILVGTDGVERMSKSRGNYIGLAEAPESQFGKVMSISDETMLAWVGVVTDWPRGRIDDFRRSVASGALHPMDAKKDLAAAVVTMYHNEAAASKARAHFERVHQRGLEPEDVPELVVASARPLLDLLIDLGAAGSRSAARRLVAGGAVTIDGERATSIDSTVTAPATVKVGPRRFYRLIPGRGHVTQ